MRVRYECETMGATIARCALCHLPHATVEDAMACEAQGTPALPSYLAARVGKKVAAFCASAVWVFRLDEWRVGYAEDDAARMTHTLWCFERGKGLAFELEVMDPYCSNFMTVLWDGEGPPLEVDIRRTTSDWVDWCITYGLEPDLGRCVWFAKMLPDAQAIVRAAVRDRVALRALVGSGCLELRDGVDDFLREHHDVQEVMVEAIAEARKYFGPGTGFAAERFVDPDGMGTPVTLFLMAKVYGDGGPARAAMDQFDAAWWFDNMQRAPLLSISMEYHDFTLTEQIDAQMRSAIEHDIGEALYASAEGTVDVSNAPPDDEAMAARRRRLAIRSRF